MNNQEKNELGLTMKYIFIFIKMESITSLENTRYLWKCETSDSMLMEV